MDKAEILAEINRLAQLLAEDEKSAAPAIRAVKVGDLEWQADVPHEEFTWEEAKAYAASLGDGWRLPTVKELIERFDYAEIKDDEWCWAVLPGDTRPWNVNVYNGHSFYTYMVSWPYHVRCVRSVGGES